MFSQLNEPDPEDKDDQFINPEKKSSRKSLIISNNETKIDQL